MSHFAKVVGDTVVEIIVAEPEFIATYTDGAPGEWIQTSYNTRKNVHYGPDGNPDGGTPLRGNYAIIGGIYDRENDVFYLKQPWPSWTLNRETWDWDPPIPRPEDGKTYHWDEENGVWVQA